MSQPAPAAVPSGARGLYAYAITTQRRFDLEDVPAVDGGTPRLIGHAGIGLVVSDVSLSTLDTVSAEDVAEDGRLAGLVRAHDGVIRAVADQAPVLPLRFGTVVTDHDAAVRLLRQRREQAERLLSHVAGHREWGIRLKLTAAPESAHDSPDPDAPSSGTEYLARRRRVRDEREQAAQRRHQLVADTHTRLASYAKDAVLRSSRTPGTVSDAAYLVAPGDEPGFFAEAERLAEGLAAEDIVLERTGPWPPYSFVREQAPQ